MGDELSQDFQTVSVDNGNLRNYLVLCQSTIIIDFFQEIFVLVQSNNKPEELIVILIELLHQDIINHVHPVIRFVMSHRGETIHEGAKATNKWYGTRQDQVGFLTPS